MSPTVHATALVLGADGVLIRGASGAGKSRLALELIERARAGGRFAALVADDRVVVEACHGRLVARAPAAIAGLVEQRGRGLMRVAHEPAAVVRAVIDLGDGGERLPAPERLTVAIAGIRLPRLELRDGDPASAAIALRCLDGAFRELPDLAAIENTRKIRT